MKVGHYTVSHPERKRQQIERLRDEGGTLHSVPPRKSRNKEIQHFCRKCTQLSAYTQTIFVIFQHTEIQYFLNYFFHKFTQLSVYTHREIQHFCHGW